MNTLKIVGLNTKWYRYQRNLTQEEFANTTNFKMAYISTIENGDANLTLKNIVLIAKSLQIEPELLFNKKTAEEAINLPKRVDTYYRNLKNQGQMKWAHLNPWFLLLNYICIN